MCLQPPWTHGPRGPRMSPCARRPVGADAPGARGALSLSPGPAVAPGAWASARSARIGRFPWGFSGVRVRPRHLCRERCEGGWPVASAHGRGGGAPGGGRRPLTAASGSVLSPEHGPVGRARCLGAAPRPPARSPEPPAKPRAARGVRGVHTPGRAPATARHARARSREPRWVRGRFRGRGPRPPQPSRRARGSWGAARTARAPPRLGWSGARLFLVIIFSEDPAVFRWKCYSSEHLPILRKFDFIN